MRVSTFLVALVAVALAGSHVSAEEISRSQLAAIGLGGLKIMPRSEAAQVRGRGALAYGSSQSTGLVTFTPLPAYHHVGGAPGVSLSVGIGIGSISVAGGSSGVSMH